MEEAKLLIAIASAIIAITALVLARRQFALARSQFDLARKVLTDNHEYSRRLYAAQLVGLWDEKTLSSRQAVMSHWAACFNQNIKIEWRSIDEVRQKQLKLRKDSPDSLSHPPLITDQMAKILNFLELIATAALNGVGDEDILKQSFDITLNRWYLILEDFRDHMKTQRGYDPWGPLPRLHKRWHSEEESKAKTGIA